MPDEGTRSHPASPRSTGFQQGLAPCPGSWSGVRQGACARCRSDHPHLPLALIACERVYAAAVSEKHECRLCATPAQITPRGTSSAANHRSVYSATDYTDPANREPDTNRPLRGTHAPLVGTHPPDILRRTNARRRSEDRLPGTPDSGCHHRLDRSGRTAAVRQRWHRSQAPAGPAGARRCRSRSARCRWSRRPPAEARVAVHTGAGGRCVTHQKADCAPVRATIVTGLSSPSPAPSRAD